MTEEEIVAYMALASPEALLLRVNIRNSEDHKKKRHIWDRQAEQK